MTYYVVDTCGGVMGVDEPDNGAVCKNCGKTYGDHTGIQCPPFGVSTSTFSDAEERVMYNGTVVCVELDDLSPHLMSVRINLDDEKGEVTLEGSVLSMASWVLGQRVVVTVGK